jgi:4-diphosphocytidyl-2-C-methyl-D-erythritol kinase
MIIREGAGQVEIDAPAKINLFFEILGKREDGYHEVETLMVPINLFDTIGFRNDSNGPVRLRSRLSSWAWHDRRIRSDKSIDRNSISPDFDRSDVAELLPDDNSNLVVRAVELLRRESGIREGAQLHLLKRIPIAAGLGGGSSDAAAALMAANIGWGLDWPIDRLASLAAELGSDVPFFLYRCAAICRGRGEKIDMIGSSFSGRVLDLVLVRPPAGLSTAEVYRASRIPKTVRSVEPIVSAIVDGDIGRIGRELFNRLQPTAKSLSVWINKLEDAFDREDCVGHLMSGSGTCYFGLCRNARHAKRAARRLEALGLGLCGSIRGNLCTDLGAN